MKTSLILLMTFCITQISFAQKDHNQIDWYYKIDGADGNDIKGLDLDDQGSTFVALSLSRELKIAELGNRIFQPSRNRAGVLMKFNPNGKPDWAVTIKSAGILDIQELFVAKNGDVLVTGMTQGDTEFECKNKKIKRVKTDEYDRGRYHASSYIFLARYTSNGDFIWAKTLRTIHGDGISIAENSVGELFWSYTFCRFLIDADVLIDEAKNDKDLPTQGIIRLKESGEIINKLAFHNEVQSYSSSHLPIRLKVDPDDNLIVYGIFRGTIHFTEKNFYKTTPHVQEINSYIAKYNTKGDFLWSNQIGGEHYQSLYSLDIDSKGRIYAVGQYHYECHISNGSSTVKSKRFKTMGSESMFYCCYSPNGELEFTDFGAENEKIGTLIGSVIAIDQNNRSHILGCFTDTLSFNRRMAPIGSIGYDPTTFYTEWQEDSLLCLNKTIELINGYAGPTELVIKNKKAVVAISFHRDIYMKNIQSNNAHFKGTQFHRACYIYSYGIPDENQVPEKKDSLNPMNSIREVLSCMSENRLNQENTWVPIHSPHEESINPANKYDEPIGNCGVIRNGRSAFLKSNHSARNTKLLLKGIRGSISVNVFSEKGKSIFSTKEQNSEAEYSIDINHEKSPAGTYFVHVIHDGHQKVLRFVIT